MTPESLAAVLRDRYRIERELGQGGMATVYLAHDVRHDRKVALKVLRPELSAILGAERFLAEIKTTANLQHPHILSLFDSGEADGNVFYVMPFVEGESLRDRLQREKQLPVEDAVRIAREVADALDYAHRHGVVHRDIKPENILLHDGRALVADFGIALAASRSDGGTRMTETGMSLGTPHYMAPEQAMGEREITPKADVYALGCVTYEMLVGEPPFTGPTAQAIIARVMTEPPRSLTLQRRTVPPHVEAAVQHALEKLPADRFKSAAEFTAALGDPAYASRATAGAAHSAAQAPIAQAPTRRLAILWAAACLLLAALAVWGWLRPMPRPPLLRYELGLPSGEQIAQVRGSRIALSGDGTQMVYVGPGQRLWHRPRRALHAQQLPGTQRALNPWISPDGSKVVFVADEAPAALRVASLGGAPTVTLADSGIGLDGVTWSDDGFIYYDGLTFGGTVGLKRIPSDGGPVQQLTVVDTAGGEADHIWPVALPNGRGVLFTIQYRDADAGLALAVWDAKSGKYHILTQAVTSRFVPPGRLLYVTSDGRLMVVPFDLDRLGITGEARQVAEEVGVKTFFAADLATSATGTVMFMTGGSADAPSEVVTVSREGKATPLFRDWAGDFRTVGLSPDGRSLAASLVQGTGQQIWIKQLPNGPSAKLTLEGALNYRPGWSPDGRFVTFVSNRPGREELFSQRADGSAPATLLVGGTPTRTVSEGFISRDGRWVIYRTVPRDIFARRLGGADTTSLPLASSRADEQSPALSPDGRWLAYESFESGRSEVYVRPFPETQAARWQVSTSGGGQPSWSHSGRELFYIDGRDSLVAATVEPGPTFTVSARRALFSTFGFVGGIRAWDVARDDQSFIMIRQQAAASGSIVLTVIENLPGELAARTGE